MQGKRSTMSITMPAFRAFLLLLASAGDTSSGSPPSQAPTGVKQQAELLNDLYDPVYSKLYDTVWHDYFRYADEVRTAAEAMAASPASRRAVATGQAPRALDVGCGTGMHVNFLAEYAAEAGYDFIPAGFDVSSSQLAQARQRNPGVKFTQGSYLNPSALPAASFDYVSCFYDACFYTPHMRTVLTSLSRWAAGGAIVTVHGIDRSKVYENTCAKTAEAYAVAGVTIPSSATLDTPGDGTSACVSHFPGFSYRSWYTLGANETHEAVYHERFFDFDDPSQEPFEKHHVLYLPPIEDTIALAKECCDLHLIYRQDPEALHGQDESEYLLHFVKGSEHQSEQVAEIRDGKWLSDESPFRHVRQALDEEVMQLLGDMSQDNRAQGGGEAAAAESNKMHGEL
eukprot:g46.t1